MKKDYRNTIIVVLLIILSFSLGFNISKPEKAIGMSASYDSNAVITTLKSLEGVVKIATTSGQLESYLIKLGKQLPDPIYTDLMSEFRRNSHLNKKLCVESAVYSYIKHLAANGDPNFKKTYRIRRERVYNPRLVTTPIKSTSGDFVLFNGMKKFTLKFMKGFNKTTDYSIDVKIFSTGDSGASSLTYSSSPRIPAGKGEKKLEITLSQPIKISLYPVYYYFEITIGGTDGAEYWEIEFTDEK